MAVTASHQKITLQVLQQSETSIRVTPFKAGTALESTVKTSRTCPFHAALVADRAREILSLLARANGGARGLLPELVAAGRAIWVDLLPAFLKEKLQAPAGSSLVLHLDRSLAGIPWELLHDGDDFLGRRFRIGRLLSVDGAEGPPPLQRRMVPPLAALVVADPVGDLPAARQEAGEVDEILEDAPWIGTVTTLTGRVTLRTLRDELLRCDLLHFAGHADAGAQGGEASLRLADGAFTAGLVRQLRGHVDFPGLVFLNACGSADDATRLSSAGGPLDGAAGIAAALLLSGVRHVVGTLWAVRDEVARLFATAFWRSLGAGRTIGAAMAAGQQALCAVHGEDSLLWADHLLYGDPTWAVERSSNLTFEDSAALDGLQARYRAELLSPDGTTRLLAAAMLLRLGDRSVGSALARDVGLLEGWLGPQATAREQRQAALVVQALAEASGLAPGGPPDELPDMTAVRALVERLRPRG